MAGNANNGGTGGGASVQPNPMPLNYENANLRSTEILINARFMNEQENKPQRQKIEDRLREINMGFNKDIDDKFASQLESDMAD